MTGGEMTGDVNKEAGMTTIDPPLPPLAPPSEGEPEERTGGVISGVIEVVIAKIVDVAQLPARSATPTVNV